MSDEVLMSETNDTVRGDEALARGALAAGIGLVTGYPGSPATAVFDRLLEMSGSAEADPLQAQWAPNEKVALEMAFGASLAGTRSLVVLKSVGMNIALDPLATISLSGCHAGMVILLGDDPGAWSSQNEQDSRWLARVAEVPIIEPISVEQATPLMAQAFAWSEGLGLPVIVRITPALIEAQGIPDEPWVLPPTHRRFLRRRNRWVVLPAAVTRWHRRLHRLLRQFQDMLEASPYDVGEGGVAGDRTAVVAVGATRIKLCALLGETARRHRILGLSSSWPLPDEALIDWLRGLEQVLVLEEGGPFIEEQLHALAHRAGLSVRILGRMDRKVPEEGELSPANIVGALAHILPPEKLPQAPDARRDMPSRTPLCDDCPYTPAFEALLEAMERQGGRERHIVIGETGCMVRANLPPMELFDVKYSLGAGLGMGIGLAMNDRRHRVVALLGDSSFFHTDINALPQAVQMNLPMAAIILDNGTTALTGGQAHPGSARDERGRPRVAVDIAAVVRGYGIEPLVCATDDSAALAQAYDDALTADEFRVIVVRGPCPRHIDEE
jgi:indolepyruvate ferredoxin oxidoreductase alpha subunit